MKQRRICIQVKDPLLSLLEQIEERMLTVNPGAKLSDYIIACLESTHEENMNHSSEESKSMELVKLIRKEANTLIKDAAIEELKGNKASGRSLLLKAAALEVESLSYFSELDDKEILSSLILILSLLKKSFEYTSLPSI